MLQEVIDQLEKLKHTALQNAVEQCERIDAHIRDLDTTKAWINDTTEIFVGTIERMISGPVAPQAPLARSDAAHAAQP